MGTITWNEKLLLMYNSVGLAPTIEIMNNTHSCIFHFKMKQVTLSFSQYMFDEHGL